MDYPPIWYLPTFHGDILLETKGKESTRLSFQRLTRPEITAMEALRRRATKVRIRQKWCDPSAFPNLDGTTEGEIILHASVEEVQKILAKALKPNRNLVTAIKFSDGSISEPAFREAPPASPTALAVAAKKKEEKKALAAATVAQPIQGCPAPDFEAAEIRAQRVMEAFLTPEQVEDFRTTAAFVSLGVDTGHRYLISSRHSPSALKNGQGRSLFDIDERRAYCVHDWEVPAPEEMLALHLFLSLPGREHFIRSIPDMGQMH